MPRTHHHRRFDLTPAQANYVLNTLVKERRISPKVVDRVLADMQREIDEVTKRLAILRGSLQPTNRIGRQARAVNSTSNGRSSVRRRPRKPVSPETLASRQLQGRYLGLIRQVPERGRGKIKRMAKEQGREAAIQAMLALRKS